LITGKFAKGKTLALIEKSLVKIQKPTTPNKGSYTEEPPQDGEKEPVQISIVLASPADPPAAMYHNPSWFP